MAPAIIDIGITFKLSGPVINLTMCGIRSPTKPIMPETETEIAASNEPVTSKITTTFLISTPRLDAAFSPRDIRFKSLAKRIDIKKPIVKKLETTMASIHVFDAKLPISQKIITETCSSAIYFKKLMPADKIAAIIIPDKIRLFEEKFKPALLEEPARKITRIRVEIAPTNANKGIETKKVPRFNKIAMHAPKAAPAETPRVYGSARGFKSMPWNKAPETASAPPTAAHVRMRGSLISIIITLSVSGMSETKSALFKIFQRRILIISIKSIFTYPIEEDIRIIIIKENENRVTRVPVLVFVMALTL